MSVEEKENNKREIFSKLISETFRELFPNQRDPNGLVNKLAFWAKEVRENEEGLIVDIPFTPDESITTHLNFNTRYKYLTVSSTTDKREIAATTHIALGGRMSWVIIDNEESGEMLQLTGSATAPILYVYEGGSVVSADKEMFRLIREAKFKPYFDQE